MLMKQAKTHQMRWLLSLMLGMIGVIAIGSSWGGSDTAEQDRTRVLRRDESTKAKAVALGLNQQHQVQCPACRCPSCDGVSHPDETHGQVTVKTPLGRYV